MPEQKGLEPQLPGRPTGNNKRMASQRAAARQVKARWADQNHDDLGLDANDPDAALDDETDDHASDGVSISSSDDESYGARRSTRQACLSSFLHPNQLLIGILLLQSVYFIEG